MVINQNFESYCDACPNLDVTCEQSNFVDISNRVTMQMINLSCEHIHVCRRLKSYLEKNNDQSS